MTVATYLCASNLHGSDTGAKITRNDIQRVLAGEH